MKFVVSAALRHLKKACSGLGAPFRKLRQASSTAARATGEYHMIRAEFASAIALVATVALAFDAINEGRAGAETQTQTASSESTIWDHNGSVMYLVANGASREFYYQKPRAGMLEVGARPGSLLFRGEVDNGQYSGTAYIFNPHCGQIPFQVKGLVLDNDERITLNGQVPRVGRNCRTYASSVINLEFRRLKSNDVVDSAPAAAVEESKPEVPSTGGSELPTLPKARSLAHTDNTSSVYIAGKGKYCKETTERGYLDCFYATLDACEKHNRSTNTRCVANPDPGT
jgi:hypothetical protein